MSGRFAGRSVIVTGSGSGIGRATAVRFAAEGASVLVADIDLDAARQTVHEIDASGGIGIALRVDVSQPADVSAMVQAAVSAFGRLDVLHNNAYWGPINTPVVDISFEDWQRTVDVTLGGVFLGCRYAIPAMIEGGGGAIVNTASSAALMGSPQYAAYCAAKGGVVSLTRSVAFDYGKKGIRANAVAPGLIETPATVPVLANPERRAFIESSLLVNRFGQPSDVAAMVTFLASDEASYINGQVYAVDGGRTIV
ncbi:SDR family NAD(P)-dependent oxidoreductase [Micromonospora sp. NPDC007271]|uniref:SDR family NAD(P)-dependent oxidoreductase n=1 Tax=Micromonospora sp. NPDC007271 TaxID=3154587 RepID=UPI0033C750A6